MGTYTELTIADYPLFESKSEVIPELMTVFREANKRNFTRKLSDRNPMVYGKARKDDDEVESAIIYACTVEVVIERLNIMGFTIERSRDVYESGRQEELLMLREYMTDSSDSDYYAEMIEVLEDLTFDKYLAGLKEVISQRLRPKPFDDHERPGLSSSVLYILDHNDEHYLGFFTDDVRNLLRAVCEVVPGSGEVIQDITDLVNGGYYLPNEPVCKDSIESLKQGHLENLNQIVITEGCTDTHVLSSSLRLLYPELEEYYSFLDFDGAKVPGGAGQLASLVKGFAAAGIGNRIIAIFDNDSAGRDAMRPLAQLKLPSNIVIMKYPDIELLRNYPTIGPNGDSSLDVNGLAASIELYFGKDVLTRTDGKMAPVQWKGLIQSMGCYQGEVLAKSEIQAEFDLKLSKAQTDPSVLKEQDWSGIDAILQNIFNAFR